MRFVVADGELTLLTPSGRPFRSRPEREAELAEQISRMSAKLRALGVDPDGV